LAGAIRAFIVAIFGLFYPFLSILVTPLNYKRGAGTNFLYRFFAGSILFAAGAKVTVDIKGNIEKDKEYIIVSNHLSYIDIPVLMKTVPKNIRFIYKKSLTKIPIFGWALYLGGYVSIDRSNARNAIVSLRKAAQKLKHGISIVMFPEGTRSTDGKTGEFKRGIFMLADFAKADIIPVTIIGTDKIMPKYTMKIKPGKVKVIIDEPVKFVKDKKLLDDIRLKIISNTENKL
jgi:1-acyl-sn-glycerol-3-phosphate acyltransferase